MITVEVKGVREVLTIFDPKKVTAAARMALNDAARSARTEADRGIRKEWNIRAAKSRQELRAIKFAKGNDLEAIVRAAGRPISLTYFGAVEARKSGRGVVIKNQAGQKAQRRSKLGSGVTVQIERGKTTRLPNAFIQTLGSGHRAVLQRKGKARLPVVNKAVVTLATMFGQNRVMNATERIALAKLEQRFDHHLDRLLR